MEKNLLDAVPATSLPRERMLLYGEKALSDQELLAILLRTGQHPYNVLELAGNLLKTFGGLALLRQATLSELEKIRGIGQVKALEIKALLASVEAVAVLFKMLRQAEGVQIGKDRIALNLSGVLHPQMVGVGEH